MPHSAVSVPIPGAVALTLGGPLLVRRAEVPSTLDPTSLAWEQEGFREMALPKTWKKLLGKNKIDVRALGDPPRLLLGSPPALRARKCQTGCMWLNAPQSPRGAEFEDDDA